MDGDWHGQIGSPNRCGLFFHFPHSAFVVLVCTMRRVGIYLHLHEDVYNERLPSDVSSYGVIPVAYRTSTLGTAVEDLPLNHTSERFILTALGLLARDAVPYALLF